MAFIDKSREIYTDKYANILTYFPDVNPKWLLTGDGEMLKYEQQMNAAPKITQAQKPNEGLPLIPIKAVAGILQLGEHDYRIMKYECEHYVIPLLERMGAQFYIEVRGDSMMKTYYPGDILGCRAVPLNDIFFQQSVSLVLQSKSP